MENSTIACILMIISICGIIYFLLKIDRDYEKTEIKPEPPISKHTLPPIASQKYNFKIEDNYADCIIELNELFYYKGWKFYTDLTSDYAIRTTIFRYDENRNIIIVRSSEIKQYRERFHNKLSKEQLNKFLLETIEPICTKYKIGLSKIIIM